jgi:hypothetical protein
MKKDDGKQLNLFDELMESATAIREGSRLEREACIRACDGVDLIGADECIAAIRARGGER